MWKRATWHECAGELEQVSRAFCDAYWGRRHGGGWPRHPEDEAAIVRTSIQGVQLLRSLALAVRSEQDFGMIPPAVAVVGALKTENVTSADATEAKHKCGHAQLLTVEGYVPLNLRQALNKIAHADPQRADYYVGPLDRVHDLLLYGADRQRAWFAAVSIPKLVNAVRALPDAAIGVDGPPN